MKRNRNRLAVVLLAAMLVGNTVACGNGLTSVPTDNLSTLDNSGASENGDGTENLVTSENSDVNKAVDPASKENYSDFYEEVNREWMAQHPLDNGSLGIVYGSEIYDTMLDRYIEIFENTSAEDYEENDPIRKHLAYYNQLKDEGFEAEASKVRIRELMDEIESVKSINQLYEKVLKNEELSLFIKLMDRTYTYSTLGRYFVEFRPTQLYDLYIDRTEEEWQILENGYAEMAEIVGYSPDEAVSMVSGAMQLDRQVYNYLRYAEDASYYYGEWDEEVKASSFPFADIMEALGYESYEGKEKHYCFFASPDYFSFMQDLFVPENLDMIKDYLAVCVLDRMAAKGGLDFVNANQKIKWQLSGMTAESYVTIEATEQHLKEYCATQSLLVDDGALARIYSEKYISQDAKDEILNLVKDLNKEVQNLINVTDWTAVRSREKICNKIKMIQYVLGSYETVNSKADVEIGSNAVDTCISFVKSNRNYNKRFLESEGVLLDTSVDLYEVNAYYVEKGNAVVICDGIFTCLESLGNDITYEEKLGYIGRMLVHEMAHSIDWDHIYLDAHGEDYAEFDKNHWDALRQMYMDIYNAVDGMTTAYGNTIRGGNVGSETYCDMVAMKCCLQLLSKQENPDYDKFFKMYAKTGAAVLLPGYDAFMCRTDSHLPYHERINWVLGQFDEFYETYEIDENGPCFIKKENRVKVY